MSNADLAPFRFNTRLKRRRMTSRAFAAGTQLEPIRIPNFGMLARLWIFLRGVQTNSNTAAMADRGPWQLLKRIKVALNQSNVTLWDTSGYGAYLVGSHTERGFGLNKAGAGDTTPHSDVYSFPLASGANTVNLTYCLPIAANLGKNSEVGLVNLQAEGLQATIDIECGAVTDANTLATGFVGTIYIGYEYFELPPPVAVLYPQSVFIRTLEDQLSVTATGDVVYDIPHMGELLQLIHTVRLNGVRSDAIDKITTVWNGTETVEQTDRWFNRVISRQQLGVELPVGVYRWDYWHAEAEVSAGDNRDIVDTTQIASPQSIITITDGTTLGSGTNFIDTVRRVMQVAQ